MRESAATAVQNREIDAYTVLEVAARLRIGRNKAYESIKNGDLPSFRLGKRILVPRLALERKLAGA